MFNLLLFTGRILPKNFRQLPHRKTYVPQTIPISVQFPSFSLVLPRPPLLWGRRDSTFGLVRGQWGVPRNLVLDAHSPRVSRSSVRPERWNGVTQLVTHTRRDLSLTGTYSVEDRDLHLDYRLSSTYLRQTTRVHGVPPSGRKDLSLRSVA